MFADHRLRPFQHSAFCGQSLKGTVNKQIGSMVALFIAGMILVLSMWSGGSADEATLESEVEIVAEMARLPMRVQDLKQLQAGDLVPLGAIDGALVRVNGRAVFKGEPGHANGQRSVRLRKKIR